jgi:hypothetical protein
VRGARPLNYEDLGAQTVKNIAEPVRVLRVMLEGGAATRATTKATERSVRKHLCLLKTRNAQKSLEFWDDPL